MCAIYVKLLYAVRIGLDWTEAMMYLLLHVTCSCILHAYVPSFLYILILICVGAFLLVSLSPFLFLALVCSMAPKRKFAPSQNPLRSWASSSNSTPSHVRFHDDKTRKDFSENFSRRGIHSEHQVILSNFFDTDLPTVIYSKGCESLYGVPITCPFVII